MAIDINQFDYIVSHFDGNNNDRDDISALPAAAVLSKSANIADKSTFFYNNNLGEPNNPSQVEDMRTSAKFAERLGITTHDYQADTSKTTDELVEILNSGKKVLAIEGGPMEAIYRGLETVAQSNPENLKNITLLSHSDWNENRDRTTKPGIDNVRTWSDLKQDFPQVSFVDIKDQNGRINNQPLHDKGFWSNKWEFLGNSDNPVLQEALPIMKNARQDTVDASDAGMHYYAITGNENGNVDDARAFLTTNPPRFATDTSQPARPAADPLTSADIVVGLYDAQSDSLIETIENGEAIEVSSTANLNIAAFVPEDSTLSGEVESMAIDLNDGNGKTIENAEPYSYFMDINGDFRGGSLESGENKVTFEAYSGDDSTGELLATISRSFTIEASSM